MLGAAMVMGLAAVGAPKAQAAEFGFRVRGPVAYVPPCPGPGYQWVAGYTVNGYWNPGRWNYVGGYRMGGPAVRFGFNRGYDRHFVPERGREHFRR
jgi:hypothetical protein